MKKPLHQDRRVGKTQMSLHTALIELMRERPYDEILVQEVLDRANVGRSTFYAHFRDKDDLLTRGLAYLRPQLTQAPEKMSGSGAAERVISFSGPMLEHAFEARHIYRSLVRGKSWGMVRQRMEEMLSDLVREELNHQRKGKKLVLPEEVIVRFLIATFFSLLSYWLEKKSPVSPDEVNEMYRRLVLPVLRGQM